MIVNEETIHQMDEDSPIFKAVIRAMKIYSEQCIKASLDKASEKLPYDSMDEKMLLESIITNKDNIILL
ncbi:hypothetical protein EG346_16950 [Chryseobacterium carnipullorum]|uniref:Uncharacterized protein n=1 Tax=Chryseobacterium carnipullorum TaxID=1124835 RepID=A0A376DVL2_CHRCU|nr:hypothetical protein [Chryseobacterium carnipullorum]AZA49763.1 hypothetical protein EG346_16950 [Chryseobacterium carnipullorum]AZA64654.1 hypothetical protein EG345_07975 [Chryseobacterium carnipullorum]STC95627.1 Uncharacterised protein [Chryseobacterium carnipullorum]